ncbi:DUF3302 domain-containing protein [Escherichia coli]|nr:DUF3302 domain-containing protein [Escherichia coli]
MFLNYFALGVLIFVFLVIFYGIIAIHDIPYLIAKKRNHPHADAIHTAGWVSLFTLHVIWYRSCGSGRRSINRSAAGACSHMLRRKRKRLTRKSPHFLTEFPGWSINSPPRKRLTIPRFRRSKYGSIDCFNLRGAGVGGL